jgi:hypothetical protein
LDKVGAMPRWWMALCSALSLALLATGIYTIVFEVERWPLTCAPMYAHPRTASTGAFRLEIAGELEAGGRIIVTAQDVRLREASLYRLLYRDYYGSFVKSSPHSALVHADCRSWSASLKRFDLLIYPVTPKGLEGKIIASYSGGELVLGGDVCAP